MNNNIEALRAVIKQFGLKAQDKTVQRIVGQYALGILTLHDAETALVRLSSGKYSRVIR